MSVGMYANRALLAKKNNCVCKMRVRCFGDMFRDVFLGMRVLLKTGWRDAV